MLNIVVPMAGRGSRFASEGYLDPKPLIQVGGKPMIQWVIENVRPSRPHRFIFICHSEHLARYPSIETTLKESAPGCEIVLVDEVTEGAACTVLLTRDLITNDDQLMIANSDQFVECSIDSYLNYLNQEDLDGLIMTFPANDPKWSYCEITSDRKVERVVEKEVVSEDATVGIYNFARGLDFVEAADEMIRRDLRVNGEFYVAPTYNLCIAQGMRIGVSRIREDGGGMHGLGTPADLFAFRSTDAYRANSRDPQAELREMTKAYVWAFNSRDIGMLRRLFSDRFTLQDPSGLFSSSDAALEYIEKIFTTHGLNLEFSARDILVDVTSSRTAIEFKLRLSTETVEGVDLIDWEGGSIARLIAYI